MGGHKTRNPREVPGKILLLLTDAVIVVQGLDGLAGHGDDGQHIEDGHQADADVAQIPDEGVGCQTAHEEHDQSQDLEDELGTLGVAEEESHVAPGVVQDADEGGSRR